MSTQPQDDAWREKARWAARLLVEWFRRTHRDMPWRRMVDDPYAVWVAETMLQQTQVATAAKRFERWMVRFPTVQDLAAAHVDEVLRMWQGLGYYARALRLHEAARVVVEAHDGVVPLEPASLKRLPGVGDYTAAAIACIAGGRPEPVLDVNAVRVLTRLFGLSAPVRAGDVRLLRETWSAMAEGHSPRDFAQALMDLGREVCRRDAPACSACPVARRCVAHASGEWERYTQPPGRQPHIRVRHVAVVPVVCGRTWMRRCTPGELWAGLWEFPRTILRDGESEPQAARSLLQQIVGSVSKDLVPLPPIRHSVTRFRVRLHGYLYVTDDERAAPAADLGLVELTWEEAMQMPVSSPQRRLRDRAAEVLRSVLVAE